jgi:Fe-S-cluster-containing dehydrogenase component/DMSO reductase anchor subunit
MSFPDVMLPIVRRPPIGEHEAPLSPAKEERSGEGLLARLLAEQQSLTAVEAFAQLHETSGAPRRAKSYQKLMPTSPPSEGQQYAFEVDLDRCSGCKSCVTACHVLNGLDEHETWRDVGLLMGGTRQNPVMQHVTTACHHCLEPACMTACPVDAYEKHPITGIVKHLDDQCFGCQYCTLACPYDVPKYHAGKGIVRKCDMCADRLSAAEAPACVQACPHEAIAIRVVNVHEVRENAEADPFLPAAPEPHLTYPTTSFKTGRVFPRNMLPADYYSVNPQHPHWPLIVMLVLTQLSVGTFCVGMCLEQLVDQALLATFRPVQSLLALGLGLLALGASTLHLGRPQYAFRAVIGLRHSWLSREIAAFGLFANVAAMYAAAIWWNLLPPQWLMLLGWSVVTAGGLGLLCSVMIYVFTQREFWSFGSTATKFTLTALNLGLATTFLVFFLFTFSADADSASQLYAAIGPELARLSLLGGAFKLLFDLSILRHLASSRNSPLKRSARLLIGPLASSTLARIATGLLGGIVMPLFLISRGESLALREAPSLIMVLFLFAATLAGELIERYQFFAAVAAPRMPGGPRR